MSDTQPHDYATEVAALDVALDMHISELRRRQDAGDVGPREGAALRVELLEAHLRAVQALRAEYFGGNER